MTKTLPHYIVCFVVRFLCIFVDFSFAFCVIVISYAITAIHLIILLILLFCSFVPANAYTQHDASSSYTYCLLLFRCYCFQLVDADSRQN